MARQLFQLFLAIAAVGVAGYFVLETPGVAAPPDACCTPEAVKRQDALSQVPAGRAAEPEFDRYANPPSHEAAAAGQEPAEQVEALPAAPVRVEVSRQTRMTPPPLARREAGSNPFAPRAARRESPVRRVGYFDDQQAPADGVFGAQDAAYETAPATTARPGAASGLSLAWQLPETANAGEQIRAALVVHNGGATTAYEVAVDAELPAGLALLESRPAVETDGQVATWSLGELAAGQGRRIELILSAEGEGQLAPAATVRAAQLATTEITLARPQLEVHAAATEAWQLGRPETLTLTVTNTGRCEATGVQIVVRLPRGLDHASGAEVNYALGALAAGESRPVEIGLSASQAGAFEIEAVVAVNASVVTTTVCDVEVLAPRLEIVAAGPKRRFVDRPATYTLTVTNPGPAPASNVRVAVAVPEGMRFAAASAGGSFDAQEQVAHWFLGRLEAATTAEVAIELVPQTEGELIVAAEATADAGADVSTAIATAVEALSALELELIEGDDPLEIGAETTHVVRVTNRGSKPATVVEVAVRFGEELEPLAAAGPVEATTDAGDVVFQPLAELAPGQVADFEIRFGGAAAGAGRATAYVRSQEQPEPVQAEVITTVYDE